MTTPIRLGLVGAGRRGRSLLRQAYTVTEQDYFLANPTPDGTHPHSTYTTYGHDLPDWVEDIRDLGVTVTDIFDPAADNGALARELCEDHGDTPTLHESFDAFLDDSRAEAVVIASPNDTHLDIAIPLLERGIHILCEKPVSITLEGHDQLQAAADSSDAVCYVGFNLRSNPLYSAFEELIRDGSIGELGMITAQNLRTPFRPGFRFERERSGGTLLEKNCHDFDLFNWYTQAEPIRVGAFTGQHVYTENTDIADHATVIVEYDSGVKATLELCLYGPFTHGGNRSYLVRGSEGAAQSAFGSRSIELYTRNERTEREVGVQSRGMGGHGGGDVNEFKTYLECILGDREPPATIQDAKKAAAIALAADRSAQIGEMVEITQAYDLAE